MTSNDANNPGPRLDHLWPGSSAAPARMDQEQAAWLRERLGCATIGVFGARGAVGREVLALLLEAGVTADRVRVFGSDRSAGSALSFGGRDITLREAGDRTGWTGLDIAIGATPADVAGRLVPELLDHGIPVSDNSSRFRLDPSARLVIPELNAECVTAVTQLVSSPNCTTTIALTAAEPVRRAFGIEQISLTSYQAASGAGLAALDDLIDHTRSYLDGGAVADRFAAFDVFPHESALDEHGVCGEEAKVVAEASRLVRLDPNDVDAVCVRVPTLRTHLVALRLRTTRALSAEEVRAAINEAAGVRLVDDGPSAMGAAGRCRIDVGRVVVSGDRHVRLIAAGDQLLKGAAWNALQNAALMLAARA